PSNIMLTPEGHVKVMDFGLAKRMTPVEGQYEEEITTKLTKDDSILGTVPYMSPEQLWGQEVDARSDIFSFGVILYEMLAGVHPFKKGGQIETANAVLSETAPPLSRYTEDIPVLLQHTVKKMLAKEPDRRYQNIADARIDLEEVMTEIVESPVKARAAVEASSEAASARSGVLSERSWRRLIPWSIAAMIAVMAGVGFWILTRPTSEPLTKFVITTPPPTPLMSTAGNDLAISPDGRRVVYPADPGRPQLYVRSLGDFSATPIAGTEGATVGSPFFSPDGESLAFFDAGQLKKVSLTGGTPITICEAPGGARYGSWMEDTIFFSSRGPLYSISAAGGKPEILATPDIEKGEVRYAMPEILPGDKALLFTIFTSTGSQIALLSLETGEQKLLLAGRQAHYVPTGHLVYALSETGTLLAAPFDLATLEVTGDSVPILEEVRQNSPGSVDYSFSSNGTLVYVPAGESEGRLSLVWVDREGAVEPLGTPLHWYRNPRLSPDGGRVAVTIQEASTDIWVYDIARQTLTRLTFEGSENQQPQWTPDGQRVTWRSIREGVPGNLFWKLADGTGAAERLTTSEFRQNPGSWSPDGQFPSATFRRVFPNWPRYLDTAHGG
ncbi:protein kinase, partial [Acidobacteria bacterium AH-259-D05]|nr:protein kinase [Acidobacteria bacterium AH-259-D05]